LGKDALYFYFATKIWFNFFSFWILLAKLPQFIKRKKPNTFPCVGLFYPLNIFIPQVPN
jgi:hypothetical protein